VSDSLLAVNVLLHHTILVDTDGCKQIERALVAGVDTVENKAHDDLLPSRTTLVPELGLFQVYNVADVLHDAMQRTGGQDLVFIVVGDGNEQLGVAVVHGRAQIVAILQGEVVGIARGSGVWQLSGSRPWNWHERQKTYIAYV
jgi:phosphoribosylformylglycinamidine (FGAM) synthase-like enzyme